MLPDNKKRLRSIERYDIGEIRCCEQANGWNLRNYAACNDMFDSMLKNYLLWWYAATNDKFRNNVASAMLLLWPGMCKHTRKGLQASKRSVSTSTGTGRVES